MMQRKNVRGSGVAYAFFRISTASGYMYFLTTDSVKDETCGLEWRRN